MLIAKDFKTNINEILEIISYEGDKEKHAEKLIEFLEKALNLKIAEGVREYFEEYFKTIGPALNDEQKQKLQDYVEKLRQEALTASA